MTDDALQILARETARWLIEPDRKQLRFNEIVTVAKSHYSADPAAGVVELVEACDRVRCMTLGPRGNTRFEIVPNELYVKGSAMWLSLRDDYAWMVAA